MYPVWHLRTYLQDGVRSGEKRQQPGVHPLWGVQGRLPGRRHPHPLSKTDQTPKGGFGEVTVSVIVPLLVKISPPFVERRGYFQ